MSMKNVALKWSRTRLVATVAFGVLLFCCSVIYALALDGLARAFPPADWHKVHRDITICVLLACIAICIMAYGLRAGRVRM